MVISSVGKYHIISGMPHSPMTFRGRDAPARGDIIPTIHTHLPHPLPTESRRLGVVINRGSQIAERAETPASNSNYDNSPGRAIRGICQSRELLDCDVLLFQCETVVVILG